MNDDCDCGYGPDNDWYACVDGSVYGPCEYATCSGVCELQGDCECPCHREPRAERWDT